MRRSRAVPSDMTKSYTCLTQSINTPQKITPPPLAGGGRGRGHHQYRTRIPQKTPPIVITTVSIQFDSRQDLMPHWRRIPHQSLRQPKSSVQLDLITCTSMLDQRRITNVVSTNSLGCSSDYPGHQCR